MPPRHNLLLQRMMKKYAENLLFGHVEIFTEFIVSSPYVNIVSDWVIFENRKKRFLVVSLDFTLSSESFSGINRIGDSNGHTILRFLISKK